MSFLGNPCPCGWALDQMNEEDTLRKCARCGITYSKTNGYWSVIETNFEQIGTDQEIEKEMSKRKHADDPSIGGLKEVNYETSNPPQRKV